MISQQVAGSGLPRGSHTRGEPAAKRPESRFVSAVVADINGQRPGGTQMPKSSRGVAFAADFARQYLPDTIAGTAHSAPANCSKTSSRIVAGMTYFRGFG